MSRATLRILAAAVGTAALAGVTEVSGQVQEQRLADPVTSFPQEFGMVSGLLELPGGRVMVADPLGQVLVVLDMAAGTADTIGRVGQGPKEYRQPDGLFWLPGDSVMLVDLGNGRLTVLDPDLEFGETTPIAQGSPRSGNMMIRMPSWLDSYGRAYFQRMMGRMRPNGEMADSADVLRWDRSTGAVDTIGMVKLQEVSVTRGGSANNQMVSMSPKPLSPQDGWAAGSDGRVVMVRSIDYHVDWVESDGQVVSGPPVDFEPVGVRNPDKEAWVDNLSSSGMSISMQNVNGQITTSFSRGGSRGTRDAVDSYEWPDVMPAFRANRVRVAPDGTAWVERYVSAGSPVTFDVFDQAGRLTKQVILPPGRRIAGFGEGVLYAVNSDELDLQWLEKYKLN